MGDQVIDGRAAVDEPVGRDRFLHRPVVLFDLYVPVCKPQLLHVLIPIAPAFVELGQQERREFTRPPARGIAVGEDKAAGTQHALRFGDVTLAKFPAFFAERGEVPRERPEADQGVGRLGREGQVGRRGVDEGDVGQAERAQPLLGKRAHRLPGLEADDEAGVLGELEGRLAGAGAGATYRGRFSDDGQELMGGWRPDAGEATTAESAYDLTMTRI